MDRLKQRDDDRRTEEKINQFIIECLFKKYFEERKEQEAAGIQRKEIPV